MFIIINSFHQTLNIIGQKFYTLKPKEYTKNIN